MAEPALDDLDLVIKTMATTIVDNAEYFAQLDSIVGDGDFGFSLRNGFEVVASDYDSWDKPNVGAVLKKVGLTISGKVGGVSGVWGTAFLRAGISAGDKTELTPDDVIALLRAAIGGSSNAASPTSATRRCSMRWSRPSTASKRASPIRRLHATTASRHSSRRPTSQSRPPRTRNR